MSWLTDGLQSIVKTVSEVAAVAGPIVQPFLSPPLPMPMPISPTVSPPPPPPAPIVYQQPIAGGLGMHGGVGGAGVVPETSFFQKNKILIFAGGGAVVLLLGFLMFRK